MVEFAIHRLDFLRSCNKVKPAYAISYLISNENFMEAHDVRTAR